MEAPSLVAFGEWSGSVPAKTYYNYTSRNVAVDWAYTFEDGTSGLTSTYCMPPGGNIFYLQAKVTKVKWHEGAC